MGRILFLIPLLALAGCASPTPEVRPEREVPREPVTRENGASFPSSWFGRWKGEIHIVKYEGKAQRIPMEITIGPKEKPGRWQFAIRYGSQKTRNYELVAVDVKKGRYQIDERNSIVLPAWYTEGELVSLFSLSDQLLTTHYQRVGDELWFSVLVTKTTPTRITGGVDPVPKVGAHPPLTYQRARLRRTAD